MDLQTRLHFDHPLLVQILVDIPEAADLVEGFVQEIADIVAFDPFESFQNTGCLVPDSFLGWVAS